MSKPSMNHQKNAVADVIGKQAGITRRLFAMIYDAALVAAITLLAAALAVGLVYLLNLIGMLDLSGYQDISDYLAKASPASNLLATWLLSAIVGFYLYFLTHGGQTLGMRAWRLKLITARQGQGEQVRATQVLIRLATAAFGLGNLMCLFDRKNCSFQDYWAETKLINID